MRPIEESLHQPTDLLPVFERLLPTAAVVSILQEVPQKFYQRIFNPLILLWCFVYQHLAMDHSCDGVLSHLGSEELDDWDAEQALAFCGRRPSVPLSERIPQQTSSYCQGRRRLPLSFLQKCLRLTASNILQESPWHWQERNVVLLDGSTLLTQAAPELVSHYGRHGNQHGAGHWPVLRCVAGFNMHTGAVTEIVEGRLDQSEQALAVELFRQMPSGHMPSGQMPTVFVGDRNFGIFLIAQAAAACGHDVVVRLTDKRAQALLRHTGPGQPGHDYHETVHTVHTLNSGEEVKIEWSPTFHDQDVTKAAPEAVFARPVPSSVTGRLLYFRLERPGYRPVDLYLFTTLCRERHPLEALVDLYGLRWHAELNLRHVKSTLGLAQLQAKSVEMARKELMAGVLAYNLIRGLMALAAAKANLSPLDLSFKRCWRRIEAMAWSWPSHATAEEAAKRIAHLFKMLSDCTLYRSQKQRSAQRAIRGRPTPYPYLKGERNSQLATGEVKS
jgi:hypothetical protein